MKIPYITTIAISCLMLFGCSKQNIPQIEDTAAVTPQTLTTTQPVDTGKLVTEHSTVPPFEAKRVSVNYLPDSVRPFVSKYYPGYRIAAASYDPLCGGAPAMDIAIRAKGKPAYSVIFLPTGHYVQREQDIPLSSVSSAMKSTLKQKYAGCRPGRQAERLELVDGTTEYSVVPSTSRTIIRKLFSRTRGTSCVKGRSSSRFAPIV